LARLGIDRKHSSDKPTDVERLIKEAARFTLEKKAQGLVILDIRGISDAADYFIMVSGETDIQTRAIADHVIERMDSDEGLRPWHVEGYRYGNWILLDYVDFILHVFEKKTREYYQLERLWGDAVIVEPGLEEGPEDRNGGPDSRPLRN